MIFLLSLSFFILMRSRYPETRTSRISVQRDYRNFVAKFHANNYFSNNIFWQSSRLLAKQIRNRRSWQTLVPSAAILRMHGAQDGCTDRVREAEVSAL